MHPSPETTVRGMIDVLVGLDQIDSILDVGSGHGGVFDHGFWTQAHLSHRGTCDIHAVREMKRGLGYTRRRRRPAAHRLLAGRIASDLVQCMEVLEHVPDSRTALEQLCAVARRLVIITSDDELVHGYNAHGDFDDTSVQAQMERINPYQRYVAQPRVSDLHELGFAVFVERMGRRPDWWRSRRSSCEARRAAGALLARCLGVHRARAPRPEREPHNHPGSEHDHLRARMPMRQRVGVLQRLTGLQRAERDVGDRVAG